MIKKLRRLYIIGSIANYDYLKIEGEYNISYVYGQVSNNLSIIFKLHIIGIITIVCSFIMGKLDVYSLQAMLIFELLLFFLSLLFNGLGKHLEQREFGYLWASKKKIPERTLKKIRHLSTILFIINILLFLIENLIAVCIGKFLGGVILHN